MIIIKNGVKLYPVCKWASNQHKMYNYNDKAAIRAQDTLTDEALSELEESQRLLAVFDSNLYNGLVYAEYNDYCKIKKIIGKYNARH